MQNQRDRSGRRQKNIHVRILQAPAVLLGPCHVEPEHSEQLAPVRDSQDAARGDFLLFKNLVQILMIGFEKIRDSVHIKHACDRIYVFQNQILRNNLEIFGAGQLMYFLKKNFGLRLDTDMVNLKVRADEIYQILDSDLQVIIGCEEFEHIRMKIKGADGFLLLAFRDDARMLLRKINDEAVAAFEFSPVQGLFRAQHQIIERISVLRISDKPDCHRDCLISDVGKLYLVDPDKNRVAQAPNLVVFGDILKGNGEFIALVPGKHAFLSDNVVYRVRNIVKNLVSALITENIIDIGEIINIKHGERKRRFFMNQMIRIGKNRTLRERSGHSVSFYLVFIEKIVHNLQIIQ